MKGQVQKILALALAGCITAAALTGCTPAAAPAGDANQAAPQEQAQAPAKPGKKAQIRFMDIIPNTERTAQFEKMVADFNAQSQTTQVVLESTPWDTAHNKLVTQGSTGNMPDVFIMHQQWYAEFINAGWVTKLDEFYDTRFPYKDQYLPYVSKVLVEADQRESRGGVYGLPDGLTTAGMFVRTDWLQEVGLTTADLETWDGIFQASQKMTDPAKNRYGFSYRGGRLGGEQMGMYVMSELGGRLYDEQGNCLLATPEGKAAIKRYTDLYINGFAPKDSINWAYSEMVQGFTSGLTGILNQTTEVIATCGGSMQDGTWTVVPFPRAKDGNIYSKADSFVFAVGENSVNKEAAYEFITYMLSPEINKEYCKVNLYIPVMQGAESDPYFNDGAMGGFVKCMSDPGFVREPYYGYFPELGEFMETIYDTEIQKYLLGKQSLDQMVDTISNYLTQKQQAYMKEFPEVPVPMPITIE